LLSRGASEADLTGIAGLGHELEALRKELRPLVQKEDYARYDTRVKEEDRPALVKEASANFNAARERLDQFDEKYYSQLSTLFASLGLNIEIDNLSNFFVNQRHGTISNRNVNIAGISLDVEKIPGIREVSVVADSDMFSAEGALLLLAVVRLCYPR